MCLFKARYQPLFRPWKHPTPKGSLKLVLQAKKRGQASSARRKFAFWIVPKKRHILCVEIVTQIWNQAITNQTCTSCKSKDCETKGFLTHIVFSDHSDILCPRFQHRARCMTTSELQCDWEKSRWDIGIVKLRKWKKGLMGTTVRGRERKWADGCRHVTYTCSS